MRKRFTIIGIVLFICANMALAQKMTVKDGDANILMEVNDEGAIGSITLPSGNPPGQTIDKLYNVGGSLYWSGSELAKAGSAGGWTDGGTSVYLTTSTDKVGIGISSPDLTLDVKDSLGINGTRLLYLPDQDSDTFYGTLYVGDGGGSLSHFGSSSAGQYNTAVGIGALNANTEGAYNTASGFWALYSNTTGGENTACGDGALRNNDTGFSNTAIGKSALVGNTTGDQNVGVGISANSYNQGGSYNTMIGYWAGHGFSTHNKDGNVFIGYRAGMSAGNAANYNIFIGYQAGYSETGSNMLYIENSNSPTPLIGGDFAADELYLNGSVGIGTTSLTHTLEVNGVAKVDQLLNDRILNINRASVQYMSSSGTISVDASYIPVEGSGGPVSSVTIATTVGSGLWNATGRILIIEGTNDTNTVTIADGGNVKLTASSRTLGAGDTLMLIWNGSDWLEVSFSDN